MHIAIRSGQLEILKILPDSIAHMHNRQNKSPSDISLRFSAFGIQEFLLKAGFAVTRNLGPAWLALTT